MSLSFVMHFAKNICDGNARFQVIVIDWFGGIYVIVAITEAVAFNSPRAIAFNLPATVGFNSTRARIVFMLSGSRSQEVLGPNLHLHDVAANFI